MRPRLDHANTRQLWAAFWVANVLFLVAIAVVVVRMNAVEPTVQQKDIAGGGSAVSGSR